MASNTTRLIVITLIFLLTSCGFSLRGADVLSSKFDTILIDSQQPNSEFSRLLSRSLEIAEVAMVPVTQEGNAPDENGDSTILSINNEQISRRAITVNPRARAAQYEIRLSVDIALANSGELLIEPETLFVERSYFEDIENISGSQEEMEIISAEMRRELVNQLMRRLSVVEI